MVRLPQDYRKLIRANIVDIHEKKKWEDELKTLNQELENKVEERTEELQKANKELNWYPKYSLNQTIKNLRFKVNH